MKKVTFIKGICLFRKQGASKRGLLLLFLFLLLSIGVKAQTKDSVSRDYRIRINHYDFDPLQNPPQKDSALNAFNINQKIF
ncbi:MAG: hypothetical protein ABI691_15265 [Ginsengibacter sp.]